MCDRLWSSLSWRVILCGPLLTFVTHRSSLSTTTVLNTYGFVLLTFPATSPRRSTKAGPGIVRLLLVGARKNALLCWGDPHTTAAIGRQPTHHREQLTIAEDKRKTLNWQWPEMTWLPFGEESNYFFLLFCLSSLSCAFGALRLPSFQYRTRGSLSQFIFVRWTVFSKAWWSFCSTFCSALPTTSLVEHN